jgi:putative endonuclease
MPRQRRGEVGSISVYYLRFKNEQTGRYYIGSTNNIKRRLSEHNRGQTLSTRRKGHWILIYQEVFTDKLKAQKREKQIKSYKGGEAFKKLISRV